MYPVLLELNSGGSYDVEWFMPIENKCESIDDDIDHGDNFEDRSLSLPSLHVILKETYDLTKSHCFRHKTIFTVFHDFIF